MSCPSTQSNSHTQRHQSCYPYCEESGFSTTIAMPNLTNVFFNSVVLSMLFSALIVYSAIRKVNKWFIVLFILTSIFLYLIMISIGDSILAQSLPPTVYPFPPNLGHNGVSNEVLGSF